MQQFLINPYCGYGYFMIFSISRSSPSSSSSVLPDFLLWAFSSLPSSQEWLLWVYWCDMGDGSLNPSVEDAIISFPYDRSSCFIVRVYWTVDSKIFAPVWNGWLKWIYYIRKILNTFIWGVKQIYIYTYIYIYMYMLFNKKYPGA